MRRREFIAALGGAAALPLAARAQQPRCRCVGYLGSEAPQPIAVAPASPSARAWHRRLCRGPATSDRISLGRRPLRRLPALAADLVRANVEVIVDARQPRVDAGRARATTHDADRVRDRRGPGRRRPRRQPGAAGRQRHRRHIAQRAGRRETAGAAARAAPPPTPCSRCSSIPTNPRNAGSQSAGNAGGRARRWSCELHIRATRSSEGEFERRLRRRSASFAPAAWSISNESYYAMRSDLLGAWRTATSCPRAASGRETDEGGGLMCYGVDVIRVAPAGATSTSTRAQGREAGRPAGAAGRPRYELIINLKTAKALGLTCR